MFFLIYTNKKIIKHILSYTEKMLLETVINFDADFEQSIKRVFKGSDYEYIINDLLKLKDKDIDVKSNKPMFLIKGNVGSNIINITDKDPMKLGRLIKLLLPDTSAKDIEKITNLWVGGVKQDLKEVKGDKIKYYYSLDNMEILKDVNDEDIKTELYDSCMIRKDDSLLDIYTSNTENIKLLFKLNEDGLITTRALLFNTLEKGWVMSRVYFNRPSEKVEFENYANDNNITILTTKRDWEHETLTVQLNDSKFKKYPYIDHFKYLNIDKKQLSTTYTQWLNIENTIYLLRETNGDFKVIQKFLTINEKFIQACENNNIELVKRLLKDDRVDPSYNDNMAFRSAYHKQNYNILEMLIIDKRVIQEAQKNGDEELLSIIDKLNVIIKNEPFVKACINNNIELVKQLLKDNRVDPSYNKNRAIQEASFEGNDKVVALLLKDKRVNPSDNNNLAIRNASESGYINVVKLLLKDKRVDPSDNNNYAIRFANISEHTDVVELLAQNEKVIQKAKEMNDTELLNILKKYNNSKIDSFKSGFLNLFKNK